jgi:prophage regulatory protein
MPNNASQLTTLSPTQDRLLRIDDVAAITSLSKSCIRLWVAQERFPSPINLSPTISVWRLTQIQAWIESLFATPKQDSNEGLSPSLNFGSGSRV